MWRSVLGGVAVMGGCTASTEPEVVAVPVVVAETRPVEVSAPKPKPKPEVWPPLPLEAEVLKDPRVELLRQLGGLKQAPRYRPEELAGAARATKLVPGTYTCKISEEYRLRECTVERTPEGHMMLTMPHALLEIRGVVWDEGKELRFAGWTTAERPFGCFNCAPHCFVDPAACDCSELPVEGSRECLAQPVRFTLRGGPNKWKGEFEYGLYDNEYAGKGAAQRVVGFRSRAEKFAVQLVGPPRR